jgi:hypothetical protein
VHLGEIGGYRLQTGLPRRKFPLTFNVLNLSNKFKKMKTIKKHMLLNSSHWLIQCLFAISSMLVMSIAKSATDNIIVEAVAG